MKKEDIIKDNAALLKEKGSLLATTDGQVFYNTPEGKGFAMSHAATIKGEWFEIKHEEKKPAAKKSKKTTDK